jgi:hypothetical protein
MDIVTLRLRKLLLHRDYAHTCDCVCNNFILQVNPNIIATKKRKKW